MEHMLQCPARPAHLRAIQGKMEVFIASRATSQRRQVTRAQVVPSAGSHQPEHTPMKASSTSTAPRRRRLRPTTSGGQGASSAKSAKWRAEHAAFQAAMRAARGGGNSSGPLEVNPHQHVGLVPCPHCGRTFSQTAADRHIPRCATTYNKPKPPPQMRGDIPQRPHTSHGSTGGRRSAPVASKWGSPSKFRETSRMPTGGPSSGTASSSRGSALPQSRGASRGGGRSLPPSTGGGGTAGNNTSMDNPLATSYYQVTAHPVAASRGGR